VDEREGRDPVLFHLVGPAVVVLGEPESFARRGGIHFGIGAGIAEELMSEDTL
jgi:hypothetical protein